MEQHLLLFPALTVHTEFALYFPVTRGRKQTLPVLGAKVSQYAQFLSMLQTTARVLIQGLTQSLLESKGAFPLTSWGFETGQ